MPRFFAPKENIKRNMIYIDGREARHILNVMRMKKDDRVVVFDGTGKEYTGFIKLAKPKSLVVEIISTARPKKEEFPRISLAQSIPKKERMDYIVEKATELGARSVIPIISERTVVLPGEEGGANRLERWKRLAVEAAKQCGRADVPEIKSIRKFYDVIYEIDDFDLVLMAHLSDDTITLKEAISNFTGGKVIIFIGPEIPPDCTSSRF
jgi:16S rRNA (uracil1498-N3)-methyltransferase